jgi:hypothetical protein
MLDEAGQDVSIDGAWRASMMAQSARDPYWQAAVQAETLRHPEQAEAIQQACARCHMPLAQVTLEQRGETARVLGEQGLLDPGHPLHSLALDGVSCTLCHQIQEEALGFPESYNGGFEIDMETPAGERLITAAAVETMIRHQVCYLPIQEYTSYSSSAPPATRHVGRWTARGRFPGRCPTWSGTTAVLGACS